jgi:peptidyl-prolyl cis-trans isomerase C
MILTFGPTLRGKRFVAAALSTTILLAASIPASAQTPAFDKEVLNLMLQSRLQKPAAQASAEEISAVTDELLNIYAVSSLPRAVELGNDPRIKAQIELQEKAILFNAFANDFIEKNAATDQEIFDVYEEQVALAPPKEFKARHILVETQSEAIALITQLQDGADFIALAKENSTGPSGPSGGDLGWFTATAMVKPFSDAVAALEDGAFTVKPVQTQFGWHVILREASRESAPPPLESVRDVIKQRIEQQKFQDFISEVRSKSSE